MLGNTVAREPNEQKLKTFKIVALIGAMCLLGASRVKAEDPCTSLHGVALDALISYLDKAQPNDGNAECVTYAIVRLGRERYEPVVPALAKFLGYRRPLTASERLGVKDHPRTIDNTYSDNAHWVTCHNGQNDIDRAEECPQSN
jgi:hypothetical protein